MIQAGLERWKRLRGELLQLCIIPLLRIPLEERNGYLMRLSLLLCVFGVLLGFASIFPKSFGGRTEEACGTSKPVT